MAAVQAVDVRSLFVLMGDLNGHHQEWLGSTRHTVMVLRPSTFKLYQVVVNWLLAQLVHMEEP